MSQGILQQDGTRCYSGPTCKIHGIANQELILKTRINALFTKSRKRFDFPERNVSQEYFELNKRNKSANGEHREALDDYIHSGYEQLNQELRSASESPLTLQQSKIIDEYINNHKAPVEGLLYRGVAVLPKEDESYLRTLQVGAIYQDKGFSSATIDMFTAVHFSTMQSKRKSIVFRISAKEAAPVGNYQEHEFLLERNKKFRIVAIKNNVVANGYKYSNMVRKVNKPSITLIDLEEI
jgi:hypothetical protein